MTLRVATIKVMRDAIKRKYGALLVSKCLHWLPHRWPKWPGLRRGGEKRKREEGAARCICLHFSTVQLLHKWEEKFNFVAATCLTYISISYEAQQ